MSTGQEKRLTSEAHNITRVRAREDMRMAEKRQVSNNCFIRCSTPFYRLGNTDLKSLFKIQNSLRHPNTEEIKMTGDPNKIAFFYLAFE